MCDCPDSYCQRLVFIAMKRRPSQFYTTGSRDIALSQNTKVHCLGHGAQLPLVHARYAGSHGTRGHGTRGQVSRFPFFEAPMPALRAIGNMALTGAAICSVFRFRVVRVVMPKNPCDINRAPRNTHTPCPPPAPVARHRRQCASCRAERRRSAHRAGERFRSVHMFWSAPFRSG